MSLQVVADRQNYSLRRNFVREVLPEYFTTDYPNLIAFLEAYYDYSDSDETISVLDDLYGLRDIERATIAQLDLIFGEIASGASRDYFADPREALRNFANFYRVKGTRYAAEGFFRAFYSEDVVVEFPKEKVFLLNSEQQTLGTESLSVVQDGALYQIFSVLLKTSIPISTWRELYKRFVHPAGFYLGGEVVIEGQAGMLGNLMPISIEDSFANILTVEGVSTNLLPTGLTHTVGLLPDGPDSGAGADYILLPQVIRRYQNMSAEVFYNTYGTAMGAIDPNSPTFDEDSTVGDPYVIRMSNTAETMDRELFKKDSGANPYMLDGYVDSGYVTFTSYH